MKLHLKLSLCDETEERFFGRGIYQLLLGVERLGSLRAASMEMGMAYTKATKILKRAEEGFGFPLTRRKSGGAGGGGSELTPQAVELLERYRELSEECKVLSDQLYAKYFSGFGEE